MEVETRVKEKVREESSKKTSTTFGFIITGARLISESGKTECVVEFPKAPASSSIKPFPSYTSTYHQSIHSLKPSGVTLKQVKGEVGPMEVTEGSRFHLPGDEAAPDESPSQPMVLDEADALSHRVPSERGEQLEEAVEGDEAQPLTMYSAEISEPAYEPPSKIAKEDLKEKLEDIIGEIDLTHPADYVYDPGEHTWRPKGRYELKKTPVVHEDVVPIDVPDVHLSELPPRQSESPGLSPQTAPLPPPPPPSCPIRKIVIPPTVTADGVLSAPIEIPEGIPLLARILPREGGGEKEKIPLERLFTPATDSGEITPRRRKIFASSSFYRPDHPTIEDQVELAQKISFSLVDENNKASRGQSMYIKRKKRSAKWVHQAGPDGAMEVEEEEAVAEGPKEKPALKLLMNPKGVQDYQAVHEQYEQLMASQSSPSVELAKEVPLDIQSPTGKGAALFAKRKKRMDQFIVDETTLERSTQSHQQQMTRMTQETTTSSQSCMISQTQSEISTTNTGFKQTISGASIPGSLQLPDLTQILTQPPPTSGSKSSIQKLKENKSSKTITDQNYSSSPTAKSEHATSYVNKNTTVNVLNNKSTKFASVPTTPSKSMPQHQHVPTNMPLPSFISKQPVVCVPTHSYLATDRFENPDPLSGLKPGSPPIFMKPDGTVIEAVSPVSNERAPARGDKKGEVHVQSNGALVSTSAPQYGYTNTKPATPSNFARSKAFSSVTNSCQNEISTKGNINIKHALLSNSTSTPASKPLRPSSLPLLSSVPSSQCSPHSFGMPLAFLSTTNASQPACGKPAEAVAKPSCFDCAFSEVNKSIDFCGSFSSKNVSSFSCSQSSSLDVFSKKLEIPEKLGDIVASPSNLASTKCQLPLEPTPLFPYPTWEPETSCETPMESCKTLPQSETRFDCSSKSEIEVIQRIRRGCPDSEEQTKSVSEKRSDVVLAAPDFVLTESKESESQLPLLSELPAESDVTNLKGKSVSPLKEEKEATDEPFMLQKNKANMMERQTPDASAMEVGQDDGDVRIDIQRRGSSVSEKEIETFIQEIERSFTATPTVLEKISVDDLEPPEFFRCVSREEDDKCLEKEGLQISVLADKLQNAKALHNGALTGDGPQISSTFSPNMTTTTTILDDVKSHYEENATVTYARNKSCISKCMSYVDSPELDKQGLFSKESSFEPVEILPSCVLIHSPVSPLPPNPNMNETSNKSSAILTSPTEGAPVYTAEVKVTQSPSVPSTPLDLPPIPGYSLLDQADAMPIVDKRRSVNFNLAAKGWGTYSDFYTPVTFAAS